MIIFRNLIREEYENLSIGQRKVAEYALENSFEFSMSTLSQIAKKADVSETTVVRFAYALDFDTFSSLQRYLKSEMINERDDSISNQTNEKNEENSLELSIKKDIEILEKLQKDIDINEVKKISALLKNAEEVRIAGYRASYSAAHWFYTKLNMMRDNVVLVNSDNIYNAPNNLLTENKESVFFLLSFPSYIRETLNIAKIGQQQGAILIVITDRHLSPVARIADISLEININVNSDNLISQTSVLSVLNFIAIEIELSNKDLYNNRFKKINSLYRKNNLFLE